MRAADTQWADTQWADTQWADTQWADTQWRATPVAVMVPDTGEAEATTRAADRSMTAAVMATTAPATVAQATAYLVVTRPANEGDRRTLHMVYLRAELQRANLSGVTAA
jgi:hypothetical protein